MRRLSILVIASLILSVSSPAQTEKLIYHEIKTDRNGNIVPWYGDEPGTAWSHCIQLVWHFWDTMRIDLNGIPYYMNHQVWKPGVDDSRGIGGDQFAMALSSWRLLYGFTGDERIKQNMGFITDYYLSHSLSPSDAVWPNIPYPYNTLVLSGIYDGDMVIGKYYTQPDKAASFAWELLQYYKMVTPPQGGRGTEAHYLDAVIQIANVLAKHMQTGDENNSPLPFKVNALTGETGILKSNQGDGTKTGLSSYNTNYASLLELLETLQVMHLGDTAAYKTAFYTLLNWMKNYPLKNNKWGPFFEDIPGFSNTQINAITFAQYMMSHPLYFPEWKSQVKNIFSWVYQNLENKTWLKYGVTVVNEQTVYQQPGNSHSSREASAELQFSALTGDTSYIRNAVRQLNWATYMVSEDGRNRYPNDDHWLTDGYGDYVRHFLRAMAVMPYLAPAGEDHLLSSSSVVQTISYGEQLEYNTYDETGSEIFRLKQKPSKILFDGIPAASQENNFTWTPLDKGGILNIIRKHSRHIELIN